MKHILSAFMIASIASFITYTLVSKDTSNNISKQESVYERVMRTGTLRCGYGVLEPFIMKDPITHEMSGIYYDYMEKIGNSLNLKIEWTEEVGWGDFGKSLENNRIDLFCSSLAATGGRARVSDFTRPLFYMPVVAFTRHNVTDFDNNPERINKEDVRIVSIDGRMTSFMADEEFPKSKKVKLPQLTAQSEQFLYITSNKADIVLGERLNADLYMRQHPDTLKEIPMQKPLRYYGLSLGIKKGEHTLRQMINAATEEIIWTGKMSAILDKYLTSKNALLEVNSPYKEK